VPMAAKAVGIGYEDLCVRILEGATFAGERHRRVG
jgi:hypothetical protein